MMSDISVNDKRVLKLLFDCLNTLRRVDPEISAKSAQLLIMIASNPELQSEHFRKRLKIAQSSCSRNLAYLSPVSRHESEGLNLIVSYHANKDRRRKSYQLTPKGQTLIRDLLIVLNCSLDLKDT